jgi:hypothetical protein
VSNFTITGSITIGGTYNGLTITNGSITGGTYNGVTLDNNAWTAYTPTITAGSGTITTKSATGRYKQIGKTVFIEINITITTNGSGAGSVVATIPITPSAGFFILAGRENAATGKMLQGIINGVSTATIFNYDNSYPGADGGSLIMTGVYEAA